MNRPLTAVTLDIGTSLEGDALGGFQKFVIILAAMAFAVDGLANQALGLAIPALIHYWHVPRAAFAPVAALGLVGVCIGAAFGGVAADTWGRRWTLIGSILLFGLPTAASAFCRGVPDLAVLRTIAGLGLGATIPAATSLVAEFTPTRRRSVAIGLALIFIPLGSTAAGLIAVRVLPVYGWRTFFAIGGILPLCLALALLLVLPESPRFLVRHPSRHRQLASLMSRLGHPTEPNTRFVDSVHGARVGTLAALLGPAIRRDTLALWSAFFFCLMGLYTMFSWAPTMLAGRGFGLGVTSSAMAAFNVGGIIGAVASTWLIYRLGSRKTLSGFCILGIVCALGLSVMPIGPTHSLVGLLAALVSQSFCIGGFQNTLYPVAAHRYPPAAKATGVGAASAAGRVGAVVSSFTGVFSLQLGGASGYFIMLAMIMLGGLVCSAMIRQQIDQLSL